MDEGSDEDIWTYSTKKQSKSSVLQKPKGSSRSTRKSKKSSIIAQSQTESSQIAVQGLDLGSETSEKDAKDSSQTPDLRRFSRRPKKKTEQGSDKSGDGEDNADNIQAGNVTSRSGEKRKASTASPAICSTDTVKKTSKKRQKRDINLGEPSTSKCNLATQNVSGEQREDKEPKQITAVNLKPIYESPKPTTQQQEPDATAPTNTPEAAKEGHCPFCQMPFICLALQSPRWHAMECMDAPLKASIECPSGLRCDSTIPSHYRRYQHKVLADHRAGVSTVVTRKREFISSETGSSFEESPPEVKHVRKLDFANSDAGSRKEKPSPIKKLKSTPAKVTSTPPKFSDVSQSSSPYFKENTGRSPPFKFTPSKKQLTFSGKNEDDTHQSCVSPSQLSIASRLSTVVSPLKPTPDYLNNKDDSFTDEDIFLCESSEGVKSTDVKTNHTRFPKTGETQHESVSKLDGIMALEDKDISELISDAIPDEIDEDKKSDISVELMAKESDLPDIICAEPEKKEITTIYSDGEEDEDWFTALQKPFEDDPPDVEYIPNPASSSHSESTLNPKPAAANQQNMSTKVGKKQMSIHSFFKCQFPKPESKSMKKENMPLPRGSFTLPLPAAVGTSSAQKWPLVRQRTSKGTAAGATTSTSAGGNGASANRGGSTGWRGKKECPFYKKMPGTPFTVDAFRYGSVPGCRAYILTHFHYDHYGGLTRKFQHPIYCSKITGNLVRTKLKVDEKYIHTIPLDTPTMVEGVELTFMEANHCPGSVIILFRLANKQVYLHTGDFRACTDMELYPPLQSLHINQLYLDTTYCDPTYSFPPQKDVIKYSVGKAAEFLSEFPNTMIAVGSYTIGKERIFRAIAEDLNCRVCVTREKKAILDCLEDPALEKRLTLDPRQAKVHVLPMRQLNYQNLVKYVEKLKPCFDRVLAFEPTGWTHAGGTRQTGLDKLRPKMKRDNVTIYGVPYSEHSSYTEMKRFCQVFRPDRILATVNNGDARSRSKMDNLFESWMKEKLESPNKGLKQTGLKGWFS